MLKHAGALARELFQNSLFEPVLSQRTERRVEAVVPIREKRDSGTQELSFGARPFILCGLPIRRLPAGTLTYTRRNGRFFLEVVGHPEFGVPFGQDRLVLLWLATEAVRKRSPAVEFEKRFSDSQRMGAADQWRILPPPCRRLQTRVCQYDLVRDQGRATWVRSLGLQPDPFLRSR
jgi:hypothetical protein